MTEEQLYVCRNGRALTTNSCDCASRAAAFDLKKYDPYVDRIRALLVPSLEYRIRCFLREFVYSVDSRFARRFTYLKRFVDTAVTRWDSLNRIAEYEIGMTEEAIRSTVRCAMRDDLVTCLLNSVVLRRRLNKICRELDALGIEDNILRRLNVWSFVNERDYRMDHDCLTDPDTLTDCNANSCVGTPCDAKEPARCEKAVQPSATSGVCCDGSIENTQPVTSDCRAHQRAPDSSRSFLQKRTVNEGNRNHLTHDAAGSRNNGPDKALDRFSNEKPRSSVSEETRSGSRRLKAILRKMYLEDCGCSTLSSRPVIARLPLPCKPSDLIGRIFQADPSLTESCLIVMRRKFEASMYNVCSCLNDILGRLDAAEDAPRTTLRPLYLSCEIRPGYISFKLKTDGTSRGVNRCLFVARVPICQNVRRCTLQRDSADNRRLSTDVEGSKSEEHRNDDNNSHDTLACIEEESEKIDDICRSDRSHVEDTAVNMTQDETDNNNEEEAVFPAHETISKRDHDLTIRSCNRLSERIDGTVSDVTLCTERPVVIDEGYRTALNTIEIDDEGDVEKRGMEILLDSRSITRNDESGQPANDANCARSSYEKVAGTRDEAKSISGNEDSDSFSRTTNIDERDRTRSVTSVESRPENTDCKSTNVCSVVSFVQNSESDKQLVELNCDRFTDTVTATDKRSERTEDDSSLNSARVEIGCDSSCSCCRDDLIDITIVDGASEVGSGSRAFETTRYDRAATGAENATARLYPGTAKVSSKDDNSLTIRVQTPRLKVSSNGINVDISYPRTVVWLASGDDEGLSTVVRARDGCSATDATDFFARALIPRKRGDRRFRHVDKREILDADGGGRNFVESSEGYPASRGRLRSSTDSTGSAITTEEYLRAEELSTRVTSDASRCSFAASVFTASEFTRSEFERRRSPTCGRRRRESQSVHEPRKLRGCVRASSSRGAARGITSVTAIERGATPRGRRKDCSADVRPRTALVTARFRDSVDRSFGRIKRLISARLARLLYDDRGKTASASGTSRIDEEFSEDIARRKGYGITSCSTSDCRGRGCAVSRESSDVILSFCGSKREGRVGGTKPRDHRSADGSDETLSSFRAIEASPWSYDTSIVVSDYLEKRKSGGNVRRREEESKRERNAQRYSKNSRHCDFRSRGTSITISSRSAVISFTGHDSKCYERCACKQQRKTRDGKRVYKQTRNGSRRESVEARRERRGDERKKYRIPMKYIGNTSDEFSGMPSSFVRTENNRNTREQSRGASRSENAKKSPSPARNRQILEGGTNRPDNDRLRKKRARAILTDTYNDLTDDLDLDLKSQLTRYVELCKSVKRSLMRTLQPDDIYEVSASSMPGSDA